MHERNCFLTLTYDDVHVPRDFGLEPEELGKFWKRARERFGSFRYYACGEYGDVSLRPHYHACVFGIDFSDDRYPISNGSGGRLYRSKELEETWTYGMSAIGELTFESAAYVARYCMKKVASPSMPSWIRIDDDTGEVFEVEKEFVRMSLKPGIGSTWFDKFMSDVYPSDEVVHNGRKFRAPRYFDLKLGEIDEAFLDGVKMARIEKAVAETRERLEVIGEVAERRLTLKRREL